MTEYLLAISIGPVQEFISAARRTRDLWFGSHLLSEICKAAAANLGTEHLIFPPSAALQSEGPVANILLAQIPGQPDEFCRKARQAANRRWAEFVAEIQPRVRGFVDESRWTRQADGEIEFYAAWAPISSPGQYGATRKLVMSLLAGRKMCRNFDGWTGDEGVPKSSLDGARESVFRKEANAGELNRSLRRCMRLARNEQLDLIGVVKRLGGGLHPYPSVSRLAADPWLQGLTPRQSGELRGLCEPLAQSNILGRIGEKYPQYGDFRYDGTAVFRSRLPAMAEEAGLDKGTEEDGPQFAAIDRLAMGLKRLEMVRGIPDPYLAVLAADGDGMGGVISGIGDRAEHHELSTCLMDFAAEAGKIVPKYRGALIYSGGDDVLALLPVDQCIGCARKLRDTFANRLGRWQAASPSLSVGIAIGHFMEPLEDLLGFAREAERAAKRVPGKNALAVHLHTRGGAPVEFSSSWSDEPDRDLASLVRMYVSGRLPDRSAHELRLLGNFYEGLPVSMDAATAADVQRMLRRKRITSPDPEWLAMAHRLGDARLVNSTAKMMVVARKLASNAKQSQQNQSQTRIEEGQG